MGHADHEALLSILWPVVRLERGVTAVASDRREREDASVIVILLLGFAPWLIVLTLAIALYLTVVELLELRPHYGWWIWWLLLVFMTHFVGYLLLRGYAFYRHRQAPAGP